MCPRASVWRLTPQGAIMLESSAGRTGLGLGTQGRASFIQAHHVKFPALQDLRDRHENLFQAPQGDAVMLFMWQDDIVGVARFVRMLRKCLHISWPSRGGQASNQP